MEWSKVGEEKGEVYCVSCEKILGYLVVIYGDVSIQCLECGKPED